MEIANFDKTRVKFLVEIKREIFRFNSLSGHDTEILVANTQFLLALATSWSLFRTLILFECDMTMGTKITINISEYLILD